MKYVVFLGDGMADTPVEALGGKTPLMVAKKENIDALAPFSEVGIAKTVPDGMKPGSDTANLAVLGYDPKSCYSGRSPLEALSMGIELAETDIAVRCNLVTLSDEENYADKTMVDYSAGEISTEEARELIDYVNKHLGDERLSFHGGISYRHCLIVHNAEVGSDLTPPHDITGKKIKRHLPGGKLGDLFFDLEKRSYDLLKDHPINMKRVAEGKNPANSIWLWGEGTKPAIPDFHEKNGIHGAVISAVDLLKGIGKGANMEVIDVPGATGNVNTDFAAKGRAAIAALERLDYVYIHVEAPDESGHQGSLEDKITSIEKIDAEIVGPVLAYLKDCGEAYHVLVCPDHPTPLATRTHSAEPIPYLLYKSDHEIHSGVDRYDEETARSTGVYLEEGFHLIDKMLSEESEGHIEGLTPDLVTFGDGSEADLSKGEEDAEAPTETEGQKEAEGESASEPSADPTAGNEGETPKTKKKGAFAAFFKKHLLLFIILIASLVIAGGLAAGHFIATYHYAFIHSEAAVEKALSKEKVTRLIFKKDITIEGDLAFERPIDLDLNKHTLTVNGTLSLSPSEDVTIGYKKGKNYVLGGTVAANKITAVGTADLHILADLASSDVSLTCGKTNIQGNVTGENAVLTIDAAEASVSGCVSGEIILSDACALALSNNATAVTGGREVRLTEGTVGTIRNAAVAYVYEGATVEQVVNAGAYYYVTKLATPAKINVLNEGNDYYCYVSEVINAKSLVYSVNDAAEVSVDVAASGTTRFKLEGIAPGKQTLKLRATANGDPSFLDSDEVTYTFDFAVKLDDPAVSIETEGDKVTIVVPAVRYAEKYVYTIDGTEYAETSSDGMQTEITDKVQTGGVHVIEVTAKSNSEYFTDSNTVMTSYVKYVKIETPAPTVTKEGDILTFIWEAVEGRSDYKIVYGENTVYTKGTSLSFTMAEGASFSVSALGGGYYRASDTYTMTAETLAELFPEKQAEEDLTEEESGTSDESSEGEGAEGGEEDATDAE